MTAKLMLSEWERFLKIYKPHQLKSKKKFVAEYAISIDKNRHYPRFHLTVKKSGIWQVVRVHLDWKRHTLFDIRNEQLIDFVDKIKNI
jgi:hypothetical protein